MKSLLKILISMMILTTQFIWVGPCVYAKTSKERYNRITVGTVEVKDWHKNIVNRYPNLNHYHWNPIYSNVQGWNKVKPPRHSIKGSSRPARKKLRKPKAHKISPKYIKYRPIVRRPRNVYKKPRHISPVRTAQKTKSAGQTHMGYRHIKHQVRTDLKQKSVSPRLVYKKTDIALTKKPISLKAPARAATKTTIAHLHKRSTDVKLGSKQVSSSLSQDSVNARLAEANTMPEVKTYKPYKTQESDFYQVNDGFNTNSKVTGTLEF